MQLLCYRIFMSLDSESANIQCHIFVYTVIVAEEIAAQLLKNCKAISQIIIKYSIENVKHYNTSHFCNRLS